MCVAIYKPTGAKAPTINDLKMCWDANPDGAGMCFPCPKKEGRLEIHKGFMHWKDFKKAYEKYDIANKKDPVLIHFRIATGGAVDGGNTHPFPVTTDIKKQRQVSQLTEYALIHNGILPFNDPAKKVSDTMLFTAAVAAGNFHKKPEELARLIGGMIGSSKVALMDGAGNTTLIGTWIDVDGVKFSNDHWKYPVIEDNWWEKYNGKYAMSDTAGTTSDDCIPVFPEDLEMRSDLRKQICPYCKGAVDDCGYDGHTGYAYYYCPECGAEFEVIYGNEHREYYPGED